ncbi:MAG: PilN domain-containing protein [Neisseriaceae bacterium]|nr:PilN domain-containing protein [Neisseriaceae bacterium]
MIKLIEFNLLPYREIARQKQRDAFNKLLALFAILSLLAAGTIWFALNTAINQQESRNQYLRDENAKLDKEIEEVKSLEQRKKDFIARKQKIEELQNERYVVAMMFNDLNTLVPDGAYLKEIKPIQDGYKIIGNALSDNKVAMFMRSLPSTGIFQTPNLKNIKSKDGVQEFELDVKMVKGTQIEQSDVATK